MNILPVHLSTLLLAICLTPAFAQDADNSTPPRPAGPRIETKKEGGQVYYTVTRPDLAQDTTFRPATITNILAEHDLSTNITASQGRDQVLVPPNFRYRLTLNASGKMRAISMQRKNALERWAIAYNAAAQIKYVDFEVEVSDGQRTFWLPWKKPHLVRFSDEFRGGGTMMAGVLLTGAIDNELLFVVVAFQKQ